MFNYNKITRTAAILALSVSALLACAEIEDPQDTLTGYLAAPSLDVDVTVDDLTGTKSLDGFEIVAPEVSQVHFVVKDKDGNVEYDADGLWTEPLVLPVGAYTVEAYSGENGFGAPYFTGTASGTISALDRNAPALSLSLANSLVNVNLSDALSDHFIISGNISLNGGVYEAAYGQWFYVPSGADLSLEMAGTTAGKQTTLSHTLQSPSPKVAYRITCGTETTDWPSIALSLSNDDIWATRIYITTPASFTGNISLENQEAVVYEAIPESSTDWTAADKAESENGVLVIKGLTPGTKYKVRARVGALVSNVIPVTPVVDGLSVSASHTFTSGELDGTDVTPSFSKSAAVMNDIGSWKLDICNAEGVVLRTQKSLNISDGSAITTTDGWPYLPVGSYKVMAVATMSDGEEVRVEVPFSTQNPVFTLTPACKTTYDYYLGGDKANANAEQGSKTASATSPSMSLYEIGSSVSISSYLMANTNYSKSVYYAAMKDNEIVVSTDGYVDYGTSKSHSIGDVHNLFTDSRAYVLSVTMKFAGTEITKTRDFHITGLPYSYNFVGGSLDGYKTDGWTCNGSLEVSNKSLNGRATTLVLDRNGSWSNEHGFVVSPRFHIPDNISVQPSVVRSVYRSSGNKERTGYIGAVSNKTTSSTAISYKVSGGNNTSGSIVGSDEWLTAFQMTPSTPFVAVDSDERSEAGWSYYFLHEVHLRYM